MKIEHVAMYVNDLYGARDFFVKYFHGEASQEYNNVKTGFRSFFLSFQDGARLEIMNRPEMRDHTKDLVQTGYIHIAFSVGSEEKVVALTKKLQADGYEIISEPRTTGDGYFESCIVGIEGNQIEITV
ncbi:MAG: VOC family protein [Lachnospiraceae bacterium]|nr:VOC family protein [Lachnospiraceae bacterium]